MKVGKTDLARKRCLNLHAAQLRRPVRRFNDDAIHLALNSTFADFVFS
jgi:hypothetical protein